MNNEKFYYYQLIIKFIKFLRILFDKNYLKKLVAKYLLLLIITIIIID